MIRAALAVSLSLTLPAASAVALRSSDPPARTSALAGVGEVAPPSIALQPPPPVEPGPDVEAVAIELAHSTGAVLASDAGEECARDDLLVNWDAPSEAYLHGAYVEPLGPAPSAATTDVNGVVICATSPFSFMGFEATLTDGGWDVVPVPYLWPEDGEGEHVHDGDEDVAVPDVAPPATPPTLPDSGAAIEGYAAYEPQRSCDPSPKAGTVALRELLVGGFGGRSMGISRACHVGGRSEHKEGRALDWGMNVHRPSQRASVESFLSQLLATDAHGNRHALARRMGVMYVIWNGRIWSSYRAEAGWRGYHGRSPHTDHVHVSLSWAGARGRTSFWSGSVADDGTLLALPPGHTAATGAQPERVPTTHQDTGRRSGGGHGRNHGDAGRRAEAERRLGELAGDREALREEIERIREERRAEREERRAERERRREERLAEREAEKAERRAEWEARKEERRQQREAEKEARRAEREAEKEERRAEREARKEERRQQREAEREARRAEREERQEAKRQERERRRAEREARQEERRREREERREQRRQEREEPRDD